MRAIKGMLGAILVLTYFVIDTLPLEAEELPDVRLAAARAVQLVELSSAKFLDTKACFTCHSQALSVMVLSEAGNVGLKVDKQNLARQIERVSELRESLNGLRVDTVGYGLWALDIGQQKPNEMTNDFVRYLLDYQKELGHWKVTVERPPAEASDFTTNYVAVRAINRFGTVEQKDEIESRIAAVKRWMATADTSNTEDEVFRLRLAKELKSSPDEMKLLVEELLIRQHETGGWAQTAEMTPDAYSTGSALVALSEAGGLPRDDPSWQRGIAFLLQTQQPDGSWHVASRVKPIQDYFESGFPHGKDQFISAYATGWSAKALLLSLQ